MPFKNPEPLKKRALEHMNYRSLKCIGRAWENMGKHADALLGIADAWDTMVMHYDTR